MFYDLAMGNAGVPLRNSQFPYFSTKTLLNVAIPISVTNAAPLQFSLDPPYQELFVYDRDLKTPLTYEWNFAIQQTIGRGRSITATYVGAAGRQLTADQFLYQPNATFFRLHIVRDTSISDYNAAQFEFEQRLSRRIDLRASYTWAHSIDTASTDSGFLMSVDPVELRKERASSDFDVRHNFTLAADVLIPANFGPKPVSLVLGNWSIGVITMARTAMPIYGILTACDDPNFCQRPDRVDGVPEYLYGSNFPGGKRLNEAAFAFPPTGRQGTLDRNAIRAFPLVQTDVSLKRHFGLGEKMDLQFTGELFNVFNHPSFAEPNGYFWADPLNNKAYFGLSNSMMGSQMGSVGSAGQSGLNPIYQAGSARSVQLSVRLKF
jgi:hypothetical protein